MALQTLALGLLLGVWHAFDVDHITALSVEATQSKKKIESLKCGTYWGLGHFFTLLILGMIFLFFGLTIPIKFQYIFEWGVGVMLVSLGIYALTSNKKKVSKNMFLVGTLHGIAGSSALLFLILGPVTNLFQGTLFLIVFGIGSILGMVFVASLIIFLLTKVKTVVYIRSFCAIFSIVFGLAIVLHGV